MILTASLDGGMKVVLLQGAKTNMQQNIKFDASEFDIDYVHKFNSNFTYSYKNDQRLVLKDFLI